MRMFGIWQQQDYCKPPIISMHDIVRSFSLYVMGKKSRQSFLCLVKGKYNLLTM